MQKDVHDIMIDVEQARAIQRRIYEDASLDDFKDVIDRILDEYLDILLNAKVKI